MTKKNDEEDKKNRETNPAQIPLLEDVIYNTSLSFTPQPKLKKPSQALDAASAPQITDLFGGSPETASSGPFSRHYEAESVESAKIKQHTSHVIDSLVQEYSEEILRRLRDELSTILDDLSLDPQPKPPEDKLD
ncbi:MAG: hypothetical protein JKY88_10315 [Pseudomonadales bacterium]|nr:hypothetical protein [Pseudomonadales bacterium]